MEIRNFFSCLRNYLYTSLKGIEMKESNFCILLVDMTELFIDINAGHRISQFLNVTYTRNNM